MKKDVTAMSPLQELMVVSIAVKILIKTWRNSL